MSKKSSSPKQIASDGQKYNGDKKANTSHMAAGFIAGMTSTVVLFPLDLIKVRFQVQDGVSGPAYKGLLDAWRSIRTNEGLRGMYSGLTPAVIASAVSWGGYFFFYEAAKEYRLANVPAGKVKLTTTDHLIASTQAGSVMVLLTNPIWLIKTRMQIQGADPSIRQYSSFTHALTQIPREEGVRGLYKGALPALLLTSHGAVQFAVYESLKSWGGAALTPSSGQKSGGLPAWATATAGILSKVAATVVTYPYQVVKSRLQRQSPTEARAEASYLGVVDCVQKTWAREGLRGFFRGLAANVSRVAPSAGITFLVYEEMLKLLK